MTPDERDRRWDAAMDAMDAAADSGAPVDAESVDRYVEAAREYVTAVRAERISEPVAGPRAVR